MSALSTYDQEALRKRGQTFFDIGSSLSPMGFGLAIMIFQLMSEILKAMTLSVEMIIRKDFGIRYLTTIRFFFGLGFIWLFQSLLALIFGLTASFWGLVTFLVVIFFLHSLSINRKFWKKGQTWYTYSFGVSRFDWIPRRARQWNIPFIQKWDDWTLYRWIEPAYLFLLGFWLQPIDQPLAWYFLVASFSLFVKNQWEFMQQRGVFLNMVDAQIMSQFQQEALSGKPKQETKGYSLATLPQDVDFDLDFGVSKSAPASNGRSDFSDTLQEMMSQDEEDSLNLSPIKA